MWKHSMVESSFGIFEKEAKTEHLLEEFFADRSYKPKNEKEKRTIEEFSMVSSAMAIMIHVAKTDEKIKQEERDEIIEQMIFQLKQRYKDYKRLSEKYGNKEKNIIRAVFDKMKVQYEEGGLDIDKTIDTVNLVFQKNPYAKRFILRLCYYTAFADNCFAIEQHQLIGELATKMGIEPDVQERIKKEVLIELNLNEEDITENKC